MERGWIDMVLQRQHPLSQLEATSRYEEGFRLLPHETLAAALAAYAAVARDTEAVVRAIADLHQAVPVPKGVPWFPADVEAWTVRWVLLHLIEERMRNKKVAIKPLVWWKKSADATLLQSLEFTTYSCD